MGLSFNMVTNDGAKAIPNQVLSTPLEDQYFERVEQALRTYQASRLAEYKWAERNQKQAPFVDHKEIVKTISSYLPRRHVGDMNLMARLVEGYLQGDFLAMLDSETGRANRHLRNVKHKANLYALEIFQTPSQWLHKIQCSEREAVHAHERRFGEVSTQKDTTEAIISMEREIGATEQSEDPQAGFGPHAPGQGTWSQVDRPLPGTP
ncbi:hypothetical protein NM208_g7551 [Fusarium decemcellulare]|uniref:Uncharacterized protein n=1 Tax=Fusarium decemcellulare TaxID=57161 RepID=A0ACC1S8L2_9HYPO|nr:hypothetical protein NM208_g7551 [Fusarium decemcellulare]